MDKQSLLKRIGTFVDQLLPENKTELAAPVETPVETPVDETAKAPELKVGDPLPDGEYEIGDQIITLKDGKIDVITPKETPETPEVPEEMMEKEIKAELKAEAEEKEIKLEKEYNVKLEEMRKEFDEKLSKLTEASKSSGIIQAPIEKEVPLKELSGKEKIMRMIEIKKSYTN